MFRAFALVGCAASVLRHGAAAPCAPGDTADGQCAAPGPPGDTTEEDAALLQFQAVGSHLDAVADAATATAAAAAVEVGAEKTEYFRAAAVEAAAEEPEHVQCPGSGKMCQGNECCPGYKWSGNKTFPCPSATPGFQGCEAHTNLDTHWFHQSSNALFDVSTAKAFAELAQASYCAHPITALVNFSCAACQAASVPFNVERADVVSVPDLGEKGTIAVYVAKLTAGADCLVSIRGSDNFLNFVRDFEFVKSEYKTFKGFNQTSCPSCEIEDGFGVVWRKVRSLVPLKLKKLGCHPHSGTNKLFVTGHSLGAAVGYIAMYDLLDQGFDTIKAFLFEPPTPGNDAFAERFSERFTSDKVWRLTHYKDPVPHVPPGWLGYQRIATEIYYPDKVAADKFVTCQGLYDTKCSYQWWTSSWALHPESWRSWHCTTPLAPGGNICNPSFCVGLHDVYPLPSMSDP